MTIYHSQPRCKILTSESEPPMRITGTKLRTLRHPTLTQSCHRLIQIPGLRRTQYSHAGAPTSEPQDAPVLDVEPDELNPVLQSKRKFFRISLQRDASDSFCGGSPASIMAVSHGAATATRHDGADSW